MHTIDRISIQAPIDRVFEIATDVERWPDILPHYRWVRILERRPDSATVEMAAWRPFGPPPLRYPAWWISDMRVDHEDRIIRYRHVAGITTGMDVRWALRDGPAGVAVEIRHDWDGPPWPLVGPWTARTLIGPVFVHGIASRTLAGIRRHAEAVA